MYCNAAAKAARAALRALPSAAASMEQTTSGAVHRHAAVITLFEAAGDNRCAWKSSVLCVAVNRRYTSRHASHEVASAAPRVGGVGGSSAAMRTGKKLCVCGTDVEPVSNARRHRRSASRRSAGVSCSVSSPSRPTVTGVAVAAPPRGKGQNREMQATRSPSFPAADTTGQPPHSMSTRSSFNASGRQVQNSGGCGLSGEGATKTCPVPASLANTGTPPGGVASTKHVRSMSMTRGVLATACAARALCLAKPMRTCRSACAALPCCAASSKKRTRGTIDM
jgi:hypothetical protein